METANQLTIRNVDERLGQALRREAKRRGTSMNRLALQLLRDGLGQSSPEDTALFDDLDHLAGTWSAEEEAEFRQNLSPQRVIDEELWPQT